MGVGQKRLARHPTTLAAQQRPQIRLTEMVKIVHHFAIHGKKSETHSIVRFQVGKIAILAGGEPCGSWPKFIAPYYRECNGNEI